MPTTLTECLLAAAAMCGMRAPERPSCHRTQLFFVLWHQLGRLNATADLQRALETATANNAFFERDQEAGRYRLTDKGTIAINELRILSEPIFPPAAIGVCRFCWSGSVSGQVFDVVSTDGNITVSVDGVQQPGIDAVRLLQRLTGETIYRQGDSAPRNILDYGVRHGWISQWLGPMLPSPTPEFPASIAIVVRSREQGRITDAKVRRAVEDRAMTMACEYYAVKWPVVDPSVAANNPYDIRCANETGSEELHVEVKGTQGKGATVELTSAEVDHARQWYPRTALVVVTGIEITVDAEGTIKGIDGQLNAPVCPWQPEQAALTPTHFRYALPAEAKNEDKS